MYSLGYEVLLHTLDVDGTTLLFFSFSLPSQVRLHPCWQTDHCQTFFYVREQTM